jgi:hypothetical protein
MRRILTVFMASPGDVTEERRAAAAAVARINRIAARDWGWEIDLRGWEDTLPGYSRPQALINPDVEACDIFIGVLWKRWGSVSGTHTSGFEEEFRIAERRRTASSTPEIMLYFKEIDSSLATDAGPQLERLLGFRRRIEEGKQLLYKTYANVSEFETLIFDHLTKILGQRAMTDRPQPQGGPTSPIMTLNPGGLPAISLLELVCDPLMTSERLAGRWSQAMDSWPIPTLPCAFGPSGPYVFTLLDFRHSASLIVGTTGSGKTEALLSIAAAAIISIPPPILRISFIDLKFGSYIAALEDVGADRLEVDLGNDPSSIDRLITEMLRRESLLVETRCRDMNEFWTRFPARRPESPFWLICVDEVCGLTFGQEDGLTRLLTIAARARPLGAHFLLGSQRIYDVGSMIRGITTRRICLRTSDTLDSLDVVGIPDAALLSNQSPGLAIVRDQLGNEPLLVRFAQSRTEHLSKLIREARLNFRRTFQGPVEDSTSTLSISSTSAATVASASLGLPTDVPSQLR